MPKLMTAAAPRASSRSRAATSVSGLPPLAIVQIPGPEAMRASLARPVTAMIVRNCRSHAETYVALAGLCEIAVAGERP